MTRPRSQNRQDFIHRATQVFWRKGFGDTSIGDLVEHTGVGRGAIYSDFGGKGELFEACLDHYITWAITPVFAPLEQKQSRLADIEAFFDAQISAVLEAGLPSKGCLVGNTLMELDSCSGAVGNTVREHFERLNTHFARALKNEIRARGVTPELSPKDMAAQLTFAWHGLLGYSRCCEDGAELKRRGKSLTAMVAAMLDTAARR